MDSQPQSISRGEDEGEEKEDVADAMTACMCAPGNGRLSSCRALSSVTTAAVLENGIYQ
jgi:hypothetical protein